MRSSVDQRVGATRSSKPATGARYEYLRELDPGTSTRSFLAIDRGSERDTRSCGDTPHPELVVVHLAHPSIARDQGLRAAFSSEARASLLLSHPNIVRTFDVVAEERWCYWVTEFVQGQTLSSVIEKQGARGKLPLGYHLVILRELLVALEYAHGFADSSGRPCPIVHRNLCPLRVLVAFEGQIKVRDYAFRGTTEVTFGRIEGAAVRLPYFAPERCLGGPVDQRCDVYAVGGMLWEALAGRPRQFGRNLQEALQIRLRDADPSIESVCSEVPPELAAISRRALAWEPHARYQTAQEFRSALDEYLLGNVVRTGREPLSAFMCQHFREEREDLERLLESRGVGVARATPFTLSGRTESSLSAVAISKESSMGHLSPSRRGLGAWVAACSISAAVALVLVLRMPPAHDSPTSSAPVQAGSQRIPDSDAAPVPEHGAAPGRSTLVKPDSEGRAAWLDESSPRDEALGPSQQASADSTARAARTHTTPALDRHARRRAVRPNALRPRSKQGRPPRRRPAADAASSSPRPRAGDATEQGTLQSEDRARLPGRASAVDLTVQKAKRPRRTIDSEDPYSR